MRKGSWGFDACVVGLLGILLWACPAAALDLKVRLHRHGDAGWRDDLRAESVYPMPATAGKTVHNGLVKNRVELMVTELPPGGAMVDMSVSTQNSEGWGVTEIEPDGQNRYVCWVWERLALGMVPNSYILLTFRAESQGESAEAEVRLYPPPNVTGRSLSPELGDVMGADILVPPEDLPPGYEHRERVYVQSSPGDRQVSRYEIRLHSVADATYRLMELESEGAAIGRYFDNGTEITDQITSTEGYTTPVVSRGSTHTITVLMRPVGRSAGSRQQRVGARVHQLSDPAVSIGSVERFDAVTCASTPIDPPPLQEGWNEE